MHGLKPPGDSDDEGNPKKVDRKTIEKMKLLTKCQTNFMQVILQKIDRRSKPIKKQEKVVNHNLKKKKIYLEEENFDILTLLQKNQKVMKTSEMKETTKKEKVEVFQEPLSIMKSKPLKSEKDRLHAQKDLNITNKQYSKAQKKAIHKRQVKDAEKDEQQVPMFKLLPSETENVDANQMTVSPNTVNK